MVLSLVPWYAGVHDDVSVNADHGTKLRKLPFEDSACKRSE